MKTFALFVATALAEIVGCYLPWLWLRQGKPLWLLLPAAASLALSAPAARIVSIASVSTGVCETILSNCLWFHTSSGRGAMLRSPTRIAPRGRSTENQARSSSRKPMFSGRVLLYQWYWNA